MNEKVRRGKGREVKGKRCIRKVWQEKGEAEWKR